MSTIFVPAAVPDGNNTRDAHARGESAQVAQEPLREWPPHPCDGMTEAEERAYMRGILGAEGYEQFLAFLMAKEQAFTALRERKAAAQQQEAS